MSTTKLRYGFDTIGAADAKRFFGKNHKVFIATAYFKDGSEVIGMEKKTKELALKDLMKELKGEGVDNMFKVLGRPNPTKKSS